MGDGIVARFDHQAMDFKFSVSGLFGVALGKQSGLELNLGGLVAGLDFWPLGIKIPAVGRIGF